MPAPLRPHLTPVVLHDQDANLIGTIGNPVVVTGGGNATNQPTFACNQKNVAVPGTAVQLQAQAVPDGFTIFMRAKIGNIGTIWVGPTAAIAQDHAVAIPLEAGAFLELALTNTNGIWIDAGTATDGVSWTVEIA